MKRYLYLSLLLGILFIAGCTKDDPTPTPPEWEPNTPAVDKVVSRYNGEVAILSNNDHLISFLVKRFPNTTAELHRDVAALLLEEERIGQMFDNAEEMETVAYLWRNNRAFIFVNPGINAITMVERLRAEAMGMQYSGVAADVASRYANIHLYIAKASGFEFLYHGIARQQVVRDIETVMREEENGELITSTETHSGAVEHNATDYETGRIAERASEWLNENSSTDMRPVLFSDDEDSCKGNRVIRTEYMPVTITHYMPTTYYWCPPNEGTPSTYTEAMMRVDVVAGYSDVIEGDVYDLYLEQSFDATNTAVVNKIVHEHLAYNWRYSGGFYYGPTVDIALHGADDNNFDFHANTDIYAPAPIPTASSYSVTHEPASTQISGSVTGGATVGASGVEGSASGTFGFIISLPSTSVTTPVDEMPLHYTSDHNAITWRYESVWELYDVHWGTNPDYREPPLITRSTYITNQAASFGVKNSKTLGEAPVYLDYSVNFKTYSELARPEIEDVDIRHESCSDHYREMQSHYYDAPMQLPAVARYFKDYQPYCFYTNGNVDGANGWNSFENTLLENVYYSVFAGTDKIRSVTEEGLNVVAETAWVDAMNSLIAMYNGSTTSYTYIIALMYDHDQHLKSGLYVHDGVWEIVDDVDAKKAELQNQ